jgi:hypothetical protein
MERLSDFPYFPLEFTKEASVHDPAQITALKESLTQGGATDLIIISHGWNNNMAEANELYRLFFANLRALIDSGATPGLAQRKLAVLGVLWPSKRFEEKELIPSGAAGVSSLTGMVAMKAKLADLKGIFDSPHADRTLDELQQLLPKLEDSSATRKEFIEKVRSLIRKGTADEEDGSKSFFATPPGEVLEKLSKPVSFTVAHAPAQAGGAAAIGTGGAANIGAGGAAGLGEFFSGIWSGVRNVLNYTTYYQMKERAGTVGANGLNPLLREIASQQPGIKLHLVGHSFGGRLVTAAVAGTGGTSTLKISSLSLLQAAFSHYGFSQKWDGASDGTFRRILTGQAVSGPTIITCTDNDKAVGLAYPIASLLAGQVAAGIGDKNDKYGGIGRNGAQKTPEAVDESLLDVNKPYSLTNGRMHNLNTTHFIRDHGDVHNAQVVYAVASAIAAAT